MIRLECDYAEGAHERVLRRLFETNLEQTPGYGEDLYCARAREYIQQLCQREGIDVHFLVGGTLIWTPSSSGRWPPPWTTGSPRRSW